MSKNKNMNSQFNIPNWVRGNTPAEEANSVKRRFKDRTDKASVETMEEILQSIADKQEYIKMQEGLATESQQIPDQMNGQVPEGMQQFSMGGNIQLSPEDEANANAAGDAASSVAGGFGPGIGAAFVASQFVSNKAEEGKLNLGNEGLQNAISPWKQNTMLGSDEAEEAMKAEGKKVDTPFHKGAALIPFGLGSFRTERTKKAIANLRQRKASLSVNNKISGLGAKLTGNTNSAAYGGKMNSYETGGELDEFEQPNKWLTGLDNNKELLMSAGLMLPSALKKIKRSKPVGTNQIDVDYGEKNIDTEAIRSGIATAGRGYLNAARANSAGSVAKAQANMRSANKMTGSQIGDAMMKAQMANNAVAGRRAAFNSRQAMFNSQDQRYADNANEMNEAAYNTARQQKLSSLTESGQGILREKFDRDKIGKMFGYNPDGIYIKKGTNWTNPNTGEVITDAEMKQKRIDYQDSINGNMYGGYLKKKR